MEESTPTPEESKEELEDYHEGNFISIKDGQTRVSPTVAKGGTDRFGVTHFYPDSPTGVKWYMTGCQIQNGSFEGKVAGGDITNGCMGTDNSKMRWDIWSNPTVCNYKSHNGPTTAERYMCSPQDWKNMEIQ